MTQAELRKLKTTKKKLIRKPKSIYTEVEDYLFYNKPISNENLSNKTAVRTAVTYLFESFMKLPRVSILLDTLITSLI